MYNTVLFIHLLAVVGAFFGMGVMLNSLVQLRTANSVGDALRCSSLAGAAAKFMPLATLVLLATGAYMTQTHWAWSIPWVYLSIAGLLIVTFVGAVVLGSRERALHGALTSATGQGLDENLAAQLRAPFLVIGSGLNAGLVCAVMFVMVNKPGVIWGIVSLVIGSAAGAGIFAIAARPRAKAVLIEAPAE
jgi:hypothetical protein